MHDPSKRYLAGERAGELYADSYVTIGGGTTTGPARRSRSSPGCRVLAVPTAYAGSEMTPICGITEGG